MKVIEKLQALGACEESIEWAERYPDPREAWQACERSDWLLWLLRTLPIDPNLSVKIAVACARRALKYVPAGEERPANAISLVERWLAGEEAVTKQELLDAAASAADAVNAASSAATYSAARAAAHAAADASYSAASSAYSAAASAANHAAYAVEAAHAAAYDAHAAEGLEQCNIIRAIVSYDTISELLDA